MQVHRLEQTRLVTREPIEAARLQFGVGHVWPPVARIGQVQGVAPLLESTQAGEQVDQRPDQAGVQIG